MRRLAAAALLSMSAAACVVEDDLDLESSEQGAGPGSGFRDKQCEQRVGGNANALSGLSSTRHVSTGNTAVKSGVTTAFSIDATEPTCLSATIGGAVLRCNDAAFQGYVFTASGTSTQFRIASATSFSPPATPGRVATGYSLEYKVGASGAWTPLCPSGTARRLALPLRGEVYKNGVLDTSAATRLSWACSDYLESGLQDTNPLAVGSFAKVTNWGYLPGSPLVTVGSTPRSVQAADVLAGAAHMANGDYCYAGQTRTIDGTAVAQLDLVTGNLVAEASGMVDASWPDVTIPPNALGLQMEAAWSESRPSGTPGQLIDNGKTVCLSRLRWQSLPLGAICSGKTPDPRVTGNRNQFCDFNTYESLASLTNGGAVLVNASYFNDAGLRIWTASAGAEAFTTTMGFHYGAAGADEPPRSGYVVSKGSALVGSSVATESLLGTILTTRGKDVWVGAFGAGAGVFAELRSCRNPTSGDRVTATPTLIPAGYSDDCKSEGWLWTTTPSSTTLTKLGLASSSFTLLYRYSRTVSGAVEYLTTTRSTTPATYGSKTTIGSILKPRTL